jgi:hypothetical protein
MESEKILDSAITASSFYDSRYVPGNGRLNVHFHGARCAWTTTKEGRDNAWFQVDLGNIVSVTGVAIQGNCAIDLFEWVTSYTVSYSIDGKNWEFFEESSSTKVGY